MSDGYDQSLPLYPNERAFIIKFRRAGLGEDSEWTGCVEHLVSGRGHRFASTEELIEFLRMIIAPEDRGQATK